MAEESWEVRFERMRLNDAVVHRAYTLVQQSMLSEMDALKVAVVAIAEQRDAIAAEALKLRQIAPRRATGADGLVYRWDAPDEFIPVE